MSLDLTVVIATHRRPELLAEAMKSALSQQGVSLELVVVDDDDEGSGKPAFDRVKAEVGGTLRYQKRQGPKGGIPAQAYNEGLALAEGRHVLFLDDDDLALPGAFGSLVAMLESDAQRAFAFGAAEPFGGGPEEMIHEIAFFLDAAARARVALHSTPRFLLAQLLFAPTLFVTSSCMFRRDLLREVGGFDVQVRIGTQLDVAARLARRHAWGFVDKPVVRYRVHSDSLMHDHRNQADLERSYQEMYKKQRAELGFLGYARLRFYARHALTRTG